MPPVFGNILLRQRWNFGNKNYESMRAHDVIYDAGINEKKIFCNKIGRGDPVPVRLPPYATIFSIDYAKRYFLKE